jgi:sugar/nucleoside kinase (ribokinase family)
MRKKNIFVIGDLVIDHTLFVSVDFERPHQKVPGEDIYEVLNRQDDAGGAANTARILSIINEGKTFLWGIIGASPWGDFRSILMNSDKHNEPLNPIEFRSVRDETDAQMNTISRMILLDHSAKPPQLLHKVRFDDYGHAHVTEVKRKSVLHYLRRAYEKYGVDAIIINDLDYGCLNVDIIKEITKFAKEKVIPIFVDPKLQKNKYEEIEVTAIMPNLIEWCHLVEEKGKSEKWRQRLSNPAHLRRMAELSISKLGNFKYHIIKCDKDGAVIIAPHPDPGKEHYYAVYQIPPAEIKKQGLPHQLGCGDVMTGMFVLEFSTEEMTTKNALRAFLRANVVVGCYREMPWHRMPTLAAVIEALEKVEVLELPKPLAELTMGRLFLPKQKQNDLFKYETSIPSLYSIDPSYLTSVQALLDEISSGWGPGHLKSIILVASSGSGKSKIAKWLEKNLSNQSSIKAIILSNGLSNIFGKKDITSQLNELLDKELQSCKQMLIIADEILKGEDMSILEEFGINLLNLAHQKNVRFLFIDADFKLKAKRDKLGSQFITRCRSFHLSSLSERPKDIPYIAIARIKEFANKNGHEIVRIKIDEKTLLAIINLTLINPNTRELCYLMDRVYKIAIKDPENNDKQDTFLVKYEHLEPLSAGTDKDEGSTLDYFDFFVK